jgi:hypothetical protein
MGNSAGGKIIRATILFSDWLGPFEQATGDFGQFECITKGQQGQ